MWTSSRIERESAILSHNDTQPTSQGGKLLSGHSVPWCRSSSCSVSHFDRFLWHMGRMSGVLQGSKGWQHVIGCLCCTAGAPRAFRFQRRLHGWWVLTVQRSCIALYFLTYAHSGRTVPNRHPSNCGYNCTIERGNENLCKHPLFTRLSSQAARCTATCSLSRTN